MSDSSDRWLRYLNFWRRDPRRDVDDELQFHLESRVTDLIASGVDPAVARARAASEFGDARAVREQTVRIDERILRRGRRADWLGDVWRDTVVGLRSLRRSPGFLAVALVVRLATSDP